MREYDDILLYEFPIQMPIENMNVGAIFMLRIAKGLYSIYFKYDNEKAYCLYSLRRENGKFAPITYKRLKEEWSKPFNKNYLTMICFLPYYTMSNKSTSYEIGHLKEETINLWKIKTKLLNSR